MPTQERMTIEERFKYLRLARTHYEKANRKERSQLLDEMERITGLDRKTIIRRMNGILVRKTRTQQRGRVYGADIEAALKVIAESEDYITAERLAPNLRWLAEHLVRHGELHCSASVLEQLDHISISTVARILKRVHKDRPHLPRKGPTQANRCTRNVPMCRLPWNETVPGHFETDLVHHSGRSSEGEYIHTLQMVDVATGWSERVALLGRSFLVMQDAFKRILTRLPISILQLHPDNGSEFFNEHLLRFWGQKVPGLRHSRSHPWKKNDNPKVEQKNDSLVRAYFGHERLDTAEQTKALNVLYDNMWLYYNFFQPVMHLVEKHAGCDNNGTYHTQRRFDRAQTPFDRLCATGVVTSEAREQLGQLREKTNPRHLRQEIYRQINALFSLPNATPGRSENVYSTLFEPIPDYGRSGSQ
jgi:hypothetical protein